MDTNILLGYGLEIDLSKCILDGIHEGGDVFEVQVPYFAFQFGCSDEIVPPDLLMQLILHDAIAVRLSSEFGHVKHSVKVLRANKTPEGCWRLFLKRDHHPWHRWVETLDSPVSENEDKEPSQ